MRQRATWKWSIIVIVNYLKLLAGDIVVSLPITCLPTDISFLYELINEHETRDVCTCLNLLWFIFCLSALDGPLKKIESL